MGEQTARRAKCEYWITLRVAQSIAKASINEAVHIINLDSSAMWERKTEHHFASVQQVGFVDITKAFSLAINVCYL
jgi:hypothetical protein